jgi:hypothetical protein
VCWDSSSALSARFLYNLMAKWIGGIEFEVESANPAFPPAG